MRYQRQCNCNSLGFIEQMLIRVVFPSGVMPLVPEQFRIYPRSSNVPAMENPGVFDDLCFWGQPNDDDYRPLGK